jgi:hypothetical protein
MEGDVKYCGIDLHGNNNWLVIINEQDRVLYSRRQANDLSRILAVLEPHRSELSGIVVESTFNWYWLVDGLQEAGYRVLLANGGVDSIGSTHRGDESDARQLAHLLRLGLLPRDTSCPRRCAVRDHANMQLRSARPRF